MEAIAAGALPQVTEDAKPEKIEHDWLVNFFDKSRLTSDEEMQRLWAAILAGEANAPGKFSKRTVNVVASLSRYDAELFQTLCRFRWSEPVDHRPIVFDFGNPIYSECGINFDTLTHLAETGLVVFEGIGGFSVIDRSGAPLTQFACRYFGRRFIATLPDGQKELSVGSVMLSRAGVAVCDLCTVQPVAGFADYVVGCWRSQRVKINEVSDGA